MGNERAHVGVQAGDGLVARYDDTVVFVPPGSSQVEGTEHLLRAVEEHTGQAAPAGEDLAIELAGLLAGRPAGVVPPFGLVAPLEGGWVVLLHGSVAGEVAGPEGTVERLDGAQAVTMVDRKLSGRPERLSVGEGASPVAVHPRSDLRAGLVPGNGFVLTPGPETAAEVPRSRRSPTEATPGGPEPSAERPVPTSTSTIHHARADASEEVTDALPAMPGAADLDGGAHRPKATTEAIAGPVGYLVADDGARIALDRSYVLGREPETDPAVKSGAATPIRVHDDHHMVSRVQSRITVESGRVILHDAGSSNGTYVAAPGASEWTRLGAEPVSLPPTWNVRIGKRIFTFVPAEPLQ